MPFSFMLTGIGNALVDVLYEINDDFLITNKLVKGQMQLSTPERLDELVAPLKKQAFLAGGSCANSMASFGHLGGGGAFIGRIGHDEAGKMFHTELLSSAIHFLPIFDATGSTGFCAVFVSRDAARTMVTSLGVASNLCPDDIPQSLIEQSAMLYLEGYLYDKSSAKQAFDKAASMAKQSGGLVALTLSDLLCVERHRDDFLAFVRDHSDILFANESEFIALCGGKNLKDSLDRGQNLSPITCITRGDQGALIVSKDGYFDIPAMAPKRVVDTTGAGDGWAAGFLYGYSKKLPLPLCGKIGAMVAGEIIGHFGAQPKKGFIEKLKAKFTLP